MNTIIINTTIRFDIQAEPDDLQTVIHALEDTHNGLGFWIEDEATGKSFWVKRCKVEQLSEVPYAP
jgi:hypothetical protein